MKTYTTGHCQVYPPAKPIIPLRELPIEELARSRRTNHAMRQLACSDEEYRWVIQALAKRRAKSPSTNKTK